MSAYEHLKEFAPKVPRRLQTKYGPGLAKAEIAPEGIYIILRTRGGFEGQRFVNWLTLEKAKSNPLQRALEAVQLEVGVVDHG